MARRSRSNSAAALRGNEAEDNLIHHLEDIIHAPVISPMKAVRKALKSLQLENVVIITPYINGVFQQIKASFENDGFHVVRVEGLNLTNCRDMAKLTSDQIARLTRTVMKDLQPEALLICGCNFPVYNQLKNLQASSPCLVLSTNQIILEEILGFGH
jgi:maleate cis-trans isomerase